MRLIRILGPALMALLMLGMAAVPISAQETDPAESADFQDIEGLQKAYVRSFSIDFMAMMESGTPDATPTGWFVLTAMAFEFDSEDNAAAGSEFLLEQLESSDVSDTGAEIEDVELDVDFDYTAKQTVTEEEGMSSVVLVATAQDGNYLYFVVGVTFGEDPVATTGSVLTSMKDADTSDDEEMFHDDGTSMGGLWAKLPTVEQVQADIPSLSQAIDEILYPTDGTPAA